MIKFFAAKIKYYLITIFILLIQGCTSVENKPLIDGITTAIAPKIWPKVVNGSLFQEKTPINYGYQPLFEDHRPHNIGDIVTVLLQENIIASNSSFSNLSRNGSTNLGIGISSNDTSSGFNLNNNNTGFNSIGKNDFSGKGSNSAKNMFSGIITTTVQQVFPNGNLKIVGEKQVAINKGTEYIRFSGVINPNNINKNNCVISNQIADSRIEYLSHGNIDEIQKMGWLQRLFSKFSPI